MAREFDPQDNEHNSKHALLDRLVDDLISTTYPINAKDAAEAKRLAEELKKEHNVDQGET